MSCCVRDSFLPLLICHVAEIVAEISFVFLESPVISFDGHNYVAFDTAENPVWREEEPIQMRFKTSYEKGVLMCTSFQKDHFILELLKGSLIVSIALDGGKYFRSFLI